MNINVVKDHIHDKYIYLDWNVFKYMKNNREDKLGLDKEFYEAICKLKKKYRLPTSLAHIKDRMRNFNEEYRSNVQKDFDFAYSISDGKFVTTIPESNILEIVNADIRGCIDEYINECVDDKKLNFESDVIWEPKLIDLEKLDKSHPMYEYLLNHNHLLDNKNFNKFIEELYEDIFDQKTEYSRLRDYIRSFDITKAEFNVSNLSELCALDKLMYHCAPMLLSFRYEKTEELLGAWKEIANRFLSLNGNVTPSMEQLLMQGYVLLDMHPLIKKEQLKKGKNTLDNIIRDGNHCYYASNAKYFISEDMGTRLKVQFLYTVYGIKTKVYSEREFLDYVTVL
jgi:hypothetical protein